jgi:protein dithiol oxidoreductase (disulfide-forming)
MQRREFSLTGLAALATLSLGTGLTGVRTAQAQTQAQTPGGLTEGKDFVRLQTPVPVTLPAAKKVEVVEFFSYSCGHCAAFEPTLEAWVKQLPADVLFRPIPYAFFGAPAQQKMFYALEEIGQREALHRKFFNAIHVQKLSLATDDEISAFVVANGVDAAKYQEALKSFSVNSKLTRGKQIASTYKIESVPTLAVQGRFITSPGMARTQERALMVVDSLVQQVRQGG